MPRRAQKKIYLIDLRRDRRGRLSRRNGSCSTCSSIPDPTEISLPARPGEFGVGDPFSFPLQSVESLELLGGERLLIANDNNYPGQRRPLDRTATGPDDVELIVVRRAGLR